MGSSFFKAGGAPKGIMGTPQGQEARAIGASAYAVRGAASGAQKAFSQVMAINKGGMSGPLKRSAAYPKGPKV